MQNNIHLTCQVLIGSILGDLKNMVRSPEQAKDPGNTYCGSWSMLPL